MTGPAEWCYYDFSTGVSNGWYKKGTYAGDPVQCVSQDAQPSYIPATGTQTQVAPTSDFHVGTGAGVGIAAAVIVAAYVTAIVGKQRTRRR